MVQLSARYSLPLSLLPLVFFLNGCAVVGGIFKAGIWVGVLVVVILIGLIVWAIRAMAR